GARGVCVDAYICGAGEEKAGACCCVTVVSVSRKQKGRPSGGLFIWIDGKIKNVLGKMRKSIEIRPGFSG
ncbi:MAG TPA: hypothetical protein VK642_06165, partial [Burkholderiales bacterium]|nr:hypothetical protein [Burkholderiales bacterium]